MTASTNWGSWSRESVALMTTRTRELFERHGIPSGAAYRWDLETTTMLLGDVEIRLVTVGTVAGDSFLWSWANEVIPSVAKAGIERVRLFGVEHVAGLLEASRK